MTFTTCECLHVCHPSHCSSANSVQVQVPGTSTRSVTFSGSHVLVYCLLSTLLQQYLYCGLSRRFSLNLQHRQLSHNFYSRLQLLKFVHPTSKTPSKMKFTARELGRKQRLVQPGYGKTSQAYRKWTTIVYRFPSLVEVKSASLVEQIP